MLETFHDSKQTFILQKLENNFQELFFKIALKNGY